MTGVTEKSPNIPHLSTPDPKELPEEPLVVIRPSTGWVSMGLAEMWGYRDLFYILTLRDIKVRYKQTLLGAAWAIIQPLFTMLIFSIFFGRLAGMPSDGVPYPLFAFAALLPWTFFSNSVTKSGNSLVGNTNLITKVYFPRMIIPSATVAAGLLDLTISFIVLGLMMAWFRVVPGITVLLLPVLVLLTTMLAVGVGMWMSALNVKYRDIGFALPFLVQLGLFVTPIIYPLSMIPEKWRPLVAINPLAGQIEAYRAVLFEKPVDWMSLGLSAVLTMIIFFYAAYSFKKMERTFADLV